MEVFSKEIPTIRDCGPFRRKGVDNYVKWINNQPEDRVVVDTPMIKALEKMGYHVDQNPASLFDITQMWDALSLYADGPNPTAHELLLDDDFKKAHNLAFKVFSKPKDEIHLNVLQTKEEYFDSMESTSSAGVPYFQKKVLAFPTAWSRYLDIISGKKNPNPCLAQYRTQRGNKTRLVWAYPMDMTLAEAKYARPLMERFKRGRFPVPWGKYRYEIGARLDSTLRKKWNVALDYSKFDSSISIGMLHLAFGILGTWFKEEDLDSWEIVKSYFITTPIVMTNGHLYTGKRKGVPSGSYFTNLIDSVINFTLIMYISNKLKLNLDKDSIHIMGDDSVFTVDSNISLNSISDLLKGLGINVSVKKSQVTPVGEPVHFIGFNWSRGSFTKPLDEVLTSAVYPERYRKYGEEEKHVREMLYSMIMLNPLFRAEVGKYLNYATFSDMTRMGTTIMKTGEVSSDYMKYVQKYVFNKDHRAIPNLITGVLQ